MKVRSIHLLSVLFIFLLSAQAHALGRKRSENPLQAYPVRQVKLGPLYNASFTLPDGRTTVSLAENLPVLMTTTFTQTTSKIQIEAAGTSVSRYEIRGGVTAFEADIQKYGVTFGFSPSGPLNRGKLVGAEGSVDVAINKLDMDFHIIDTQANPPVVLVAATASAKDIKGSLTASVDFGKIETGASFFAQTSITEVFRKVMRKAMEKIVANPRTNFLMGWSSPITNVDYDFRTLYFDAGRHQGIESGHWFTVYDDQEYRLGEVQVDYADLDYSSAKVLNDPDGYLLERIKIGNQLKIYYHPVPVAKPRSR